jgi:ABC-type multidrug transport system fused ATPase/permease subunit
MPAQFVALVVEFVRLNPGISAANLTLALALSPVGDVLLPHLYGKLVSSVERKGHRAAFVPTLMVIAALAAWQIGFLAKDMLDMQTQPRVVDHVRTRMIASVLDMHDGNLAEQPKVGQLVSKIVRSPELVAWWSQTVLDYIIPYVASLTVVAVYFFWHDPWLAASLVVFVVAAFLLLVIAPRRCLSDATRRESALQDVHERTDDVLRNLASVYGADATAAEVAGVAERGEAYRRANVDAMLCLMRYKTAGVPLIVGFVGAVVLRCVHLVGRGRMTVGAFVSIFMMATASVGTLSWLVSIIKEATLDMGTLEHAQIMFWPSKTLQPMLPRAKPMSALSMMTEDDAVAPRIEVVHVDYSHDGKKMALRDVSIVLEAGVVSVLSGPVGSGKSTVLRLLAALTRPSGGDVYIGGVSYADLGLARVRQLVGYMPQEAVLFDRTAGENLLYGAPPGTTETDAVDLAKALGLWDSLSPGLPQGLATQVGKGGSKLSGGQRQLLWFLRLALRDPPALVLDEPTASMDAETRDALIEALGRLTQARKKTIVMATHDAGLAAVANQAVDLPPSSS